MTATTIITLLGGEAADGATLESASFRLSESAWPGWLAVILLVATAFAWWVYRRSPMDVKPVRRLVLTGLRALFVAMMAVVFLRPLLVLTTSRSTPRTLLLGIDCSESFGIRDLNRNATRTQTAARILTSEKLNILPRLCESLSVAAYAFGDDVATLDLDAASITSLQPDAPATAVESALEDMLSRHAGEPLAGVVLVTDGNVTRGRSLEAIASSLQSRGVPLHIVGIGATETTDAGLVGVEGAETALAGDVLPVRVRVRSQGLAGEAGRIVLSLSGVDVAQRPFVFTGGADQDIDLEFLPPPEGTFDLQARVQTARQELLDGNNQASGRLRVLDGTIRVLMIEQSPRWEFKYIQAMLLREDRVDLECLLLEGDPAVTRVPGSPYLEGFPQRGALFGYDLVILGDVDPSTLTDLQWRSLTELVADAGGALVVIAGKRFMPSAYRHSVLEPALPVELQAETLTPRPATQPWRLLPTRDEPMLVLTDDPEHRDQAWRELPPVYWTAEVAGAKPAADVLLVAIPDGSDTPDERGAPVAVLQRYGAGEVLFLGTDNTWRWRRNAGDRIHTRFWGQIVQRLAGARLVEGSRRASIQTDRRRYEPGQRVAITATLRSVAWEPLTEETVMAVVEADDGSASREVTMKAVPGQPGNYLAEILAGSPGGTFRLTVPDHGDILPVEFEVRTDNRELEVVTVDTGRLRRVAQSTGGAFFYEDEAAALPERIVHRSAEIRHTREVALWASPLYFIFLLLLLTAEWILRKACELK